VLPCAAVRPKLESVGLIEAGAVGVLFVTAYEGYRRTGDVVLVLGANGKVGQAAKAADVGRQIGGALRHDCERSEFSTIEIVGADTALDSAFADGHHSASRLAASDNRRHHPPHRRVDRLATLFVGPPCPFAEGAWLVATNIATPPEFIRQSRADAWCVVFGGADTSDQDSSCG
jgi:hypothetical protein